MPSAPVCKNSTWALTLPNTVFIAMAPIVPGGIGPLERTAEPPVSERRCKTPTKRVSLIEKRARSLLGTRIRGARGLLSGFSDFFTVIQHRKREHCGQGYRSAMWL